MAADLNANTLKKYTIRTTPLIRELCTAREAFIREQMRKRLGQDADEVAASSSQMHPEDELYAVPSDLQVCTKRQAQAALNHVAQRAVTASCLSRCKAVSSVWWVGKHDANAHSDCKFCCG